jgi:hypothetical protein
MASLPSCITVAIQVTVFDQIVAGVYLKTPLARLIVKTGAQASNGNV